MDSKYTDDEGGVEFGILDFPCGAERLPDGYTLIADAGNEQQQSSEILKVDLAGNVVWKFTDGLLFAHSAVPMRNGSILITDTTNNRVIAVDADGDVVFTSESWGGGNGRLSDGSHLNYPNDAHETVEGNLLITDRNNDRCVIVDLNGAVLWEYSNDVKHPHNADPLPSGNVLIADSDNHRVIEVNRNKEIVWSYGDKPGDEPLNWPRDADRCPNGNTLICDSKNSRVIEVTPESEIVWRFGVSYFANFYDADVLENGNVLIADQQHQRIIEVDRFGNIVWQFRNYRPSFPVYPTLRNGGFMEIGEDGVPQHWKLMTRVAEGGGSVQSHMDETVGRHFPVLSFDRSGAVCLMQLVAVSPGKRYRIAAQLSTTNMAEGSFACLQLAYRDCYGGWFEDVFDSPKSRLIEGETDWTEEIVEVVAPEQATTVEVRIMLVGPGQVRIRRVMMIAE